MQNSVFMKHNMSKIKKETILQIWGNAEDYQTSSSKQRYKHVLNCYTRPQTFTDPLIGCNKYGSELTLIHFHCGLGK